MIDPKDWKVGDIVRVKGGDRDWPIECVLSNSQGFRLGSNSGLTWQCGDLRFVRTSEDEAVRKALENPPAAAISVVPSQDFTVTFPPTAKTVNVSVHLETKCSVNGTVVQPGPESPKDAKPHPFYVGQRLICVDDGGAPHRLTEGHEYYARECLYSEGGNLVIVSGCNVPGWAVSRFKPAPFKVGDKVKAIKPLPCEDPKDFTITSVKDRADGCGQWLRFDGEYSGEPCGSFHLVTPAPEKPEHRFKPGDRVCCVKPIDGSHLVPESRLKVDRVNRGESLTVKVSVAHLGDEIVSLVEFNDISFDAKNFRKVDSFKFGDYVKCVSIPRKTINPKYADFKVGEVALVTGVLPNCGWVQLQGKTSLYYDPAHFTPCEAPKTPEPAPFRVGDVVTCVDASTNISCDEQLVQGGDYVVVKIDGNAISVKASGSTYAACGKGFWYSSRFVRKVIKKPAQVTFCGVDMGAAEVDSSSKWYDMGNRRAYRDAFVTAFEKAMKNAPPTKLEPLYGPSPLQRLRSGKQPESDAENHLLEPARPTP